MSTFVNAFKNRQWETIRPIFISGEGRPTLVVDVHNRKVYQYMGDDLVEVNPAEFVEMFPNPILADLSGKEPASPAVDLQEEYRPPDLPAAVLVEAERVAMTRRHQRRTRTE